MSYLSAWKIQLNSLKRKGENFFGPKNEMLIYHFIQAGLVVAIALIFSPLVAAYFLAAALIGILLLETVNYIEHYGLQRELTESGKYESVLPYHSWNSDHIIGRVMLFELSRHSDHHFKASRKYQVLRHMEDSPQMPTGYPGMILLALIPPAWFYVMHKQIRKFQRGANQNTESHTLNPSLT
jgi:alkane 1-monooxygenase